MKLKLTMVLWMAMVALSSAATPFYSARLSDIAKAIGVNLPDTMEKSLDNDSSFFFKGRQLRVRTNALGDVSHIGYKLFNNDLMAEFGESPVFDFMERYLLELDLLLDGKTMSQRMSVDNVVITKGNANMLRLVDQYTPFSIETLKRRAYKVTWTVKGKALSLSFPADCQLMKGCNSIELDNNLLRDLPRQWILQETDILKDWKKAKVSFSDSVRILDNGSYLIDKITSRLYYRKFHGKEQLMCTSKSPAKSIGNIMLTGIFRRPITLELKVDKYSYQSDTILVTLQQFLSFCRVDGCRFYMGIKDISEKDLLGTLFILNDKFAYNHVLSFRFPKCLLQGKDDAIYAKLYAYIPLQNIAESYFNQNLKNEYKYEIK